MTPAMQIMQELQQSEKTVETLAQKVYGSYDNYTKQCVHAIIHTLRRKGFKIVSRKDPIDFRVVHYVLDS